MPFTYPPFAALLFLPLSLIPLGSAAVAWWAISFTALLLLVRAGFEQLVSPLGGLGRWCAFIVIAVASLVLAPVTSVFALGQVGLMLAALCLIDMRRVANGSAYAGALIGVAAAIKLTPAAFLLTLFAAGQRRSAYLGLATLAGLWTITALVLPGDTREWLGVVFTPDRIGPSAGALNFSLRGVLLRSFGPGLLTTGLWILAAACVLSVGVIRSSRAMRLADPVMAATTIGLTSVLVSPISWPHHAAWIVPAIGISIGTGRSWRRWVTAAVIVVAVSMPVMWWIDPRLADPNSQSPANWFAINAGIVVMLLIVCGLKRDPRHVVQSRSRQAEIATAA